MIFKSYYSNEIDGSLELWYVLELPDLNYLPEWFLDSLPNWWWFRHKLWKINNGTIRMKA